MRDFKEPELTAGISLQPTQVEIIRSISAILQLTKPGISIFIGLTAWTALLFHPNFIELPLGYHLILFLSGFLCSAGAGAFNQYYETDLDRLMERTRNRPLPCGVVSREFALVFSFILLIAGVSLAWLGCSLFTAIYLASGALTYIILYTLLTKRRTPWNVVIGGMCGMFAALAGSTGTNGSLTLAAFGYAAILYFWSAPHFWSLAIVKKDDYIRGGVPMLPVVVGEFRTAIAINLHAILLIPPAGLIYKIYPVAGFVIVMAGLGFVLISIVLIFKANGDDAIGTRKTARKAFFYSLAYLLIVNISLWSNYFSSLSLS